MPAIRAQDFYGQKRPKRRENDENACPSSSSAVHRPSTSRFPVECRLSGHEVRRLHSLRTQYVSQRVVPDLRPNGANLRINMKNALQYKSPVAVNQLKITDYWQHREDSSGDRRIVSTSVNTPSLSLPLSNPVVVVVTPSSEEPSSKPRGLPNLGNTCFMNAMIQSLFAMKFFVDLVAKERAKSDHNFPMTDALLLLRHNYDNDNSEAVKTSLFALKTQVGQRWPHFLSGGQQDASEFLTHVIDAILDELDSSQVRHVFESVTRGRLTCALCRRMTAENMESLRVIHLSFTEEVTSLETAFDGFLATESTRHECECGHKEHRLAKEWTSLADVLWLQLGPYSRDGAKRVPELVVPEFLRTEDVLYRLVAAVLHHGLTLSVGHYTCFVLRSDQWFKCDDDLVTTSVDLFRSVRMASKTSGFCYFYVKNVIYVQTNK